MSAHTQELSFTQPQDGRGTGSVLYCGLVRTLLASLFICSDDKHWSNSKAGTPRRVPALLEPASTLFTY